MYILAGLKDKILDSVRELKPIFKKWNEVARKVVRDDPDENTDELSRSRWFGAKSPGTVGFYLTLRSRPVLRKKSKHQSFRL